MKTTLAALLVAGLLALAGCSANEKPAAPAPTPPAAPGPGPNDSGATNLKFTILGPDKVSVYQNAETDIEMPVIRHAEFTVGYMGGTPTGLALSGKFQGDVKLASEVVKGGKGLTVKFDPETVKGSEDKSTLRIKAAADGDLGDVEVKLTATTSEGKTTSTSLKVEVYKKK
jgi:hypothetical protein